MFPFYPQCLLEQPSPQVPSVWTRPFPAYKSGSSARKPSCKNAIFCIQCSILKTKYTFSLTDNCVHFCVENLSYTYKKFVHALKHFGEKVKVFRWLFCDSCKFNCQFWRFFEWRMSGPVFWYWSVHLRIAHAQWPSLGRHALSSCIV
jgi:hypothetical protein